MDKHALTFSIKRTAFDEDYCPAENTRLTTNFANLARGERRKENLRNTLQMIDNRFNSLAHWDNPTGDRYSVELQIVSVEATFDANGGDAFPLMEMLQTYILDKKTGERIEGIFGNNLSSYVRDYDFSIVMRTFNGSGVPESFGELHGKLFKHFLGSAAYGENFKNLPVVCISVSSNKTYHRTGNEHPLLGVEYENDESSSTDEYFGKMGMKVRYFMPKHSVAPLAFYHVGDILRDYTNLELSSTISVMETFQKIYRPEIYNANSVAAEHYRPSLNYEDYSLTRIKYDREERSRLAMEQGRFAEEHFIKPYQPILAQWSTNSNL